jgi:hypothetical protein
VLPDLDSRRQAIELSTRRLKPIGTCGKLTAAAATAAGRAPSRLATRVILSGFPSWPGLLWRAYQLADTTDVLILPTVVRPGGKVDVVVTRDIAPHG